MLEKQNGDISSFIRYLLFDTYPNSKKWFYIGDTNKFYKIDEIVPEPNKKSKELNIKVAYLHTEVKTLERLQIIHDLRIGKYDVVVGINLLREGIDIPEVSLIAIMDADKEGFLRSSRSLIQTIGRCARNANGHVIMYGDKITDFMQYAIDETMRRRNIQEKYNKEHGIIPKTINKEIREVVSNISGNSGRKVTQEVESNLDVLELEMREAAKNLDFERAVELRDIIFELQSE